MRKVNHKIGITIPCVRSNPEKLSIGNNPTFSFGIGQPKLPNHPLHFQNNYIAEKNYYMADDLYETFWDYRDSAHAQDITFAEFMRAEVLEIKPELIPLTLDKSLKDEKFHEELILLADEIIAKNDFQSGLSKILLRALIYANSIEEKPVKALGKTYQDITWNKEIQDLVDGVLWHLSVIGDCYGEAMSKESYLLIGFVLCMNDEQLENAIRQLTLQLAAFSKKKPRREFKLLDIAKMQKHLLAEIKAPKPTEKPVTLPVSDKIIKLRKN